MLDANGLEASEQDWQIAEKYWCPHFDSMQAVPQGRDYSADSQRAHDLAVSAAWNMIPTSTITSPVWGFGAGMLTGGPIGAGIGAVFGLCKGVVYDVLKIVGYGSAAAGIGLYRGCLELLNDKCPHQVGRLLLTDIFKSGVQNTACVLIALGIETPESIQARFTNEYKTERNTQLELQASISKPKLDELLIATLFIVAYESSFEENDTYRLSNGNKFTNNNNDPEVAKILCIFTCVLDASKAMFAQVNAADITRKRQWLLQILQHIINPNSKVDEKYLISVNNLIEKLREIVKLGREDFLLDKNFQLKIDIAQLQEINQLKNSASAGNTLNKNTCS